MTANGKYACESVADSWCDEVFVAIIVVNFELHSAYNHAYELHDTDYRGTFLYRDATEEIANHANL